MSDKIPVKVVHHSRNDPREHTGGVETFGRNLALMFEEVAFTTPKSSDIERYVRERRPVICDNQNVLDWPDGHPVIGFQHGVAAVKKELTGSRTDRRLAKEQAKAANRDKTLWVACAQWIARTFDAQQGNGAKHVVYHPVDVDRFDGKLDNEGSRVVLHDGRTEHKGKDLFEHLVRTIPDWSFESLSCRPDEVPDRMRKGAAFLHLSRYEGNSIVCNEAMAMDLPCMFTRVGLMQDGEEQFDVRVVPSEAVYGDRERLVQEVRSFLDSLADREYHPRRWTMEHATPALALESWRNVMVDFQALSGWDLGLG